jgi:DNA-binding Lrp family transcriptional regulator
MPPAHASIRLSLPIHQRVRLIAELHTSINVAMLRPLRGNVDRLLVLALLMRTALTKPERDGAISIHSAALSLGRPFETVRRHIAALIESGLCHRIDAGVTMSPRFWRSRFIKGKLQYAHDCFVRFVADATVAGAIEPPTMRAVGQFTESDGVCAVLDLVLALVDQNRNLFPEAVDVAIFSAILHANTQRFAAEGGTLAARGESATCFRQSHAVRVAAIARALSLPDTTVRRRIAAMTGPSGPLMRTRSGTLVDPAWLERASAMACEARHGSMQLILNRVAVAGFPFHAPASCYLEGRPDSPRID